MCTECIRHPETGPKIMRILNTIQHQYQSGLGEGIKNILDVYMTTIGIDICSHSLVSSTPCHAIESSAIAHDQPKTLRLCHLRQITRTLIATSGIKEDLLHAVWILTQSADDCMEAEY
jgi:hypothetical protein